MPWAAVDCIYLVTNDGHLVCLLRHDGRIHWVTPLQRFADPEDQEERIRWLGPVLAGDRLIIAGSHGEVLSVSPYDGKPLGFIALDEGAAVPPDRKSNVCTPVTNAHLVCRLLLEKKK